MFTRWTDSTHPGTVERRARAIGISNAEGVLGEGTQGPTGVVEEL